MTTYVFGREPGVGQPRIVLDDRTVSRRHGTISVNGSGSYVLSDTDSTGGTFIRDQAGWRRITRAVVWAHDEIRLGTFVTTVEELLRRSADDPYPINPPRLERNPETGEIVKKVR